ncbi:BAG family molecular chaperone regulator 6 [Corylus avellana]|uniref:BAG family molecular chaperone regulator 6 n=1 Tax=Corylus avellana TaxID=13451 RepID=UPI00286CE95B|nr:BAG family molecular chaperone regulator 6 [Corylus avellana]
MIPVYRCMDSYPHQKTQMPFTYYHPGFEVVPPHMRIDPTKPYLAYESWPCGRNYNYPMPWNSCCNHNSFPGYYNFRPPYPHIPPLSPMHCCGGDPAYHEAYHPVHDVPPPHYSMDLPRYEYDKNMPRNYHCCGCPNHTHNQKEDKGVKIQEKEPDVERKGSNSVVPVQMKKYPYPIVWIPQEYMNNEEDGEPCESKAVEADKVLCAVKPPESLKSNECEPRVWNGLVPFDMNKNDSLMQGGDGKRTQNQQNEDKMRQFPFPIIWMPNHDKQEEAGKEDTKEMDPKPESAKEPPYIYNSIAVNPPQSDDFTNSPKANEKKFENQGGSPTMEEKIANQKSIPVEEKTTNQKNIPVKKMESHKEESSEETHSRGRSVNTTDKASGTSSKRQYSSPPKTPKLSPVCLRVDPLPRKKNGYGNLQSLSPPHLKGHSNDAFRATTSSALNENPHQDSRSQNSILNSGKEMETYRKEKVIEMMEGKTSKDNDGEQGGQSQTQIPVNLPKGSQEEVSVKPTVEETGKHGEECKIQEDKGVSRAGDITTEEPNEAKKVNDSAKLAGDEGKLEKKTLPDEEAAMRIQSAYHGYEVRKREPLKKLKQIAEVRHQMLDVRNRIQILESSSDLQIDNKQIAVIGETIMRLLLKLDTIQGLHPTVRDIRKSLAKELVTLHEKLDSLMIKLSEEAIEEASTSEHMEQHPVETHSGSCMQEEGTDAAAEPGESTFDKNCNSNQELMESHESLLLDTTTLSCSQMEKNLGSPFANKEGNEKSEVENRSLPVASGVLPKEAGLQKNMEQIDEVVNVELDISQVEPKNIEKENTLYSELEHSTELPLFGEDQFKSEGRIMRTSSDVDCPFHGIPVQEMEELLHGVTDAKPPVFESEKDEQVRLVTNEVQESGVESNVSSDVALSAKVDDLMTTNEGPEADQLEELPERVIEEGPAVSDFKKHEQVEVDGGRKCDVALNVTSPNDETQVVTQFEQQALEVPQEEQIIVESPDSTLEVAVEPPSECLVVSESAEPQPIISVVETEGRGEVPGDLFGGVNDVNYTCSPVLADTGVTTETEVPNFENRDDHDEQPVAIREENKAAPEAGEESQDEVEIDQTNGSETVKEDEAPLHVEKVEVEKVCVDEHDLGLGSDKRLVEENEKLKEIMERLMEAGKEQLTVISNLNARVKDLEKKLSRRKKLRARQYGPSRSCVKPVNKPLKERGVGVAM